MADNPILLGSPKPEPSSFAAVFCVWFVDDRSCVRKPEDVVRCVSRTVPTTNQMIRIDSYSENTKTSQSNEVNCGEMERLDAKR